MDDKLTPIALTLFRIAIGSFMLFGHGLGKLQMLFSGQEIQFFSLFGLGPTLSLALSTLAEFVAALFIIFGLFTRLSSLVLIINMAVASFLFHAQDNFATKEKALLFLVSFILLYLTGPGRFSLQNAVMKREEGSTPFLLR